MSFKARRVDDTTTGAVQPFAWEATTPSPLQPSLSSAPPVRAATAPAPADPIDTSSIERDAFTKGYAQGERAGLEAAATRADAMLRRLAQTIEELGELRNEMIHRTERQAVQLVLAIAERIVQREITLDRTLLLGMARVALDRLGEYGSATIRLNPEDYQAVSAKPSIEGAAVEVLADSSVPRGGCHVQSDFGFMDVSPESQFRELARALLSDEATVTDHASDSPHAIVLK
jgi:flagellar biosynthesis/type III secretory pathway protein FliH